MTKLSVKFNTIRGAEHVSFTKEECKNSDMEPIFDYLEKEEAVRSAVYNLPHYGRIECELVND